MQEAPSKLPETQVGTADLSIVLFAWAPAGHRIVNMTVAIPRDLDDATLQQIILALPRTIRHGLLHAEEIRLEGA